MGVSYRFTPNNEIIGKCIRLERADRRCVFECSAGTSRQTSPAAPLRWRTRHTRPGRRACRARPCGGPRAILQQRVARSRRRCLPAKPWRTPACSAGCAGKGPSCRGTPAAGRRRVGRRPSRPNLRDPRGQDAAPDLPVGGYHGRVDRQCRLRARCRDALLYLLEEFAVIGRGVSRCGGREPWPRPERRSGLRRLAAMLRGVRPVQFRDPFGTFSVLRQAQTRETSR